MHLKIMLGLVYTFHRVFPPPPTSPSTRKKINVVLRQVLKGANTADF
jgi:hypothetical protein